MLEKLQLLYDLYNNFCNEAIFEKQASLKTEISFPDKVDQAVVKMQQSNAQMIK